MKNNLLNNLSTDIFLIITSYQYFILYTIRKNQVRFGYKPSVKVCNDTICDIVSYYSYYYLLVGIVFQVVYTFLKEFTWVLDFIDL